MGSESFKVKTVITIPEQVISLNFIVDSGFCVSHNLRTIIPFLKNPGFGYDTKNRYKPTYTDLEISWDEEVGVGGVYYALEQAPKNVTPFYTVDDGAQPLSFLIDDIIARHKQLEELLGQESPIDIYCLTCRAGRAELGNALTRDSMMSRVAEPRLPKKFGGAILKYFRKGYKNKTHKSKTYKNKTYKNKKVKRL